MALSHTRKGFLDTEEGKEIKYQLQQMIDDSLYSTTPSYSANTILYPDNLIPFVDKHLNYLINHPSLEASKYLANIKLTNLVHSG